MDKENNESWLTVLVPIILIAGVIYYLNHLFSQNSITKQMQEIAQEVKHEKNR